MPLHALIRERRDSGTIRALGRMPSRRFEFCISCTDDRFLNSNIKFYIDKVPVPLAPCRSYFPARDLVCGFSCSPYVHISIGVQLA